MFAALLPVYNLQKKLRLAAIERALTKIPVKCLKTEDKEVQGEGECCAICIEPYEVSETLKSLPCGHDFHENCIDPWLLEHHTCPMCKMDIVKYYGQSFMDSQEMHELLQLEIEESRRPEPTPARIPILPSDNSHEEAVSERSSQASSDELVPSVARTSDSHRRVSSLYKYRRSQTWPQNLRQQSNTSSPPDSRQEAASSSTAQDSAGVSLEP